jgi:hypothetical protein
MADAPTVILEVHPADLVVRIRWEDREEAYRQPREDAGPETYTIDGMVSTAELLRATTVAYREVDEILVQSVWTREGRVVKDSRWVISRRATVEATAVVAALA